MVQGLSLFLTESRVKRKNGGFFLLQVSNLHKSFQSGKTGCTVLRGVSLQVDSGEFVAVMGPSGSGKTTLLNCISRYLTPDSGSILLDDTDLSALEESELAAVRNQKFGFVFQDFLLLDGLTVRDNIMLPRIIGGKIDSSMEREADELCALFGISHIRDKYPAEISGGEKQRTAVARALINRPSLILADEPTGNLDSKSSRAVIDSFLRAQHERNTAVFMVTHDSFAASFCDRVIVLQDGTVRWSLMRGGQGRRAFQDCLLSKIRELGEVDRV